MYRLYYRKPTKSMLPNFYSLQKNVSKLEVNLYIKFNDFKRITTVQVMNMFLALQLLLLLFFIFCI